MAYNYGDFNIKKGKGSNNLALYSFDANGSSEVRYYRDVSFDEIFRTAKKIYSDAFAKYAGSMYRKESITTMPNKDASGNPITEHLNIDLTCIEHVVGLPLSKLKTTSNIFSHNDKGFIDYLNYFIYANKDISSGKSINDLDSGEQIKANEYLDQLINYDKVIVPSISANLVNSSYEDLEKMLTSFFSIQERVLDLLNKPLFSKVKELYTYSLFILKNINKTISNLTKQLSKHKFQVKYVDDIVKVDIKSGFENIFYSDVLSILVKNLMDGSNINSKDQTKLVFDSLKDSKKLLEFLRKYKTELAPTLTGFEFDELITSQYNNIKAFVINGIVDNYDKTNLSIDGFLAKEKKDDKNRISMYISRINNSKDSKVFLNCISNMNITDVRMPILEGIPKEEDLINALNIINDLINNQEITPELYISILSFMNKYYEGVNNILLKAQTQIKNIEKLEEQANNLLSQAETLADTDEVKSDELQDAALDIEKQVSALKQQSQKNINSMEDVIGIFNFLDNNSSIAYKYITVENEFNTLSQGNKSINNSNLKKKNGNLKSVFEFKEMEDNELITKFIDIRSRTNAKINKFRQSMFFDDLVQLKNYDIDSLSAKSIELINKYGIAFIFSVMLEDTKMYDLFKYEYLVLAMLEGKEKNIIISEELPTLILPRNPEEDDFEYLKRVWNNVSKITSFEYKCHQDGSLMTYKELIDEYIKVNNLNPNLDNKLFRRIKDKNRLTSRDVPNGINSFVSLEDAIEQFKCLKMHIYDSASSKKDIYYPYMKTIIWDKIICKSELLDRIDEGIFSIALLRKAVDYVIPNDSSKDSVYNSDIDRVGLILEIPTTSHNSILLYLEYDNIKDANGNKCFTPKHILGNIFVGDTRYEIYLPDGTLDIRKILDENGAAITNPIVGAASSGIIDSLGQIDIEKLRKHHLMTKQKDYKNISELYGLDLIVSEGGVEINNADVFDIESQELKEILRSYGIIVIEDQKNIGGGNNGTT